MSRNLQSIPECLHRESDGLKLFTVVTHSQTAMLAPLIVTLAPIIIKFAPVIVTFARVFVTLAPVLVGFVPVIVTLAPLFVTLAPVIVTLAPFMLYGARVKCAAGTDDTAAQLRL